MEQEIINKVAVITGGSRGIGFAIAEELLKEGVKTVIILSRNVEKGNDAANKLNSKYGRGKAVFIQTDITKDLNKALRVIVEKYKTIDILVNNAAIVDESDTKNIFDVNTIALIEWSLKFVEHMRIDKGGKGGVILNISSLNFYVNGPLYPVYRATKSAVVGFSKSLGHMKNFELTGVRVLTICPPATATEFSHVPHMTRSLLPEYEIQATKSKSKRQEPSDVGKAAVEVIRTAASGSAWLVAGKKSMREIFNATASKV